MTDACSALPQGAGFIGSVTSYIDCQAQVLGSGTWAALAMPGSTLSILLTGFLTIFIALIGYNLLLGSSLTIREMTVAFVKIGAVFALATSWPAYRTVVYDLVTDGPGQLVREVGPRAGITGSDGTLVQRLDLADRSLVQLTILGAGYVPSTPETQVAPPPFVGFDSFALGGSRILFLLSAIAGLSVVRIVTGLMLALGPFFIAFLLFDGTRGLFEGWVRVLGGTALAAVSTSIVLGMELGLLGPWLSTVLAHRMAGEPLPAAPTELFVIGCLFAMAVLAALYVSMRVAYAFRLPAVLRVEQPQARPTTETRLWPAADARAGRTDVERTRAAAIAGAITSVNARSRDGGGAGSALVSFHERSTQVRTNLESACQTAPLGRTYSRKPGSRVSALAAKRDASA